jgi:hypothetical protein
MIGIHDFGAAWIADQVRNDRYLMTPAMTGI